MSAYAPAHVHTPPRWSAIEAHVAQTINRIGAPPVYLLRAGTNDNDARKVLREVAQQWPYRAVGLYAGMITIGGCE